MKIAGRVVCFTVFSGYQPPPLKLQHIQVKGPILRGLAGRTPYFHNGSAASFEDVVNFYDQRFAIGFTDQEKADLVAFLKTP